MNPPFTTHKTSAILYLVSFLLLLFIACKKDPDISGLPQFPFENAYLRLELKSTKAPSNIRDLLFLDETTGFVVTYDGKIYKTADKGSSWELKYTNPSGNQPFFQIYFTEAEVGYAVGGTKTCSGTNCVPEGGLIVKTTDGGNTWVKVFQVAHCDIVSVTANKSGELFALSNGPKGRIHRSTNAGIDWTIVDSCDVQLQKIFFTDNFGYASGMRGKIFRSSDKGKSWELINTLLSNYATDIKFTAGKGYCLTDNAIVYNTTDDGSNWSVTLPNRGNCFTLAPLTAKSCLVFGAGNYTGGDFGTWSGKITQTTNGGENWMETELQDIEAIRYASFYSTTEGYAVSGNKIIKVAVK